MATSTFKKLGLAAIIFCAFIMYFATTKAQYKVHTTDITNFWEAYDSVQTTTDKAKQLEFIQKLYVERGTEGLKAFMESRGGKPEIWQQFISQDKERFERIRPYTLSVLNQKSMIDESLEKFKNLYPKFKDADVYFTIGIGNSGGTVTEDKVLIGCEVMATEKPDWAHLIVLHEFVHTQQYQKTSGHVLSQSIYEGMADFISELVTEKKIAESYPTGHIAFAQQNQTALWEAFKKELYANDDYNYFGWLYGNGGKTIKGINMNDLGYGMGYLICKRFYENATDKKAAIHEMLTTEFNDENARTFLLKSGFVPEKDLDYIKNFKFEPLKILNGEKIEKVLYGYEVNDDEITFILESKDVPFKIESLTVAGSFNNWNPKSEGYGMQLENGVYKLSLPKKNFEPGKRYHFKFVANENSWLQPPLKAKNSENDGSGNINLYLQF